MTPPDSAASLQELLDLIQVVPAGDDCFRGHSEDIGTPNVFGGQVLGQALMAACLTVPDDRPAHSLHAYFLLPGKHAPIDYAVQRARDGGSFTTRRVEATQDGVPIFELMASFQRREQGLQHQDAMRSVPGPDGVRNELEYRRSMADRMPALWRDKALRPTGLEYRAVEPFNLLEAPRRDACNAIWIRSVGPLPDRVSLHQALLAYASDHGLLLTATLPHGRSLLRGELQLASIDHSMWFHRDFRLDDWLLYQVDSPTAQGNRALCRGSVYTRDGLLVASVAQEGLMRVRASAG